MTVSVDATKCGKMFSGLPGMKFIQQSVTCAVGATVTATGLIPDGAVVLGLSTLVTTAIGNGSGTTGYAVGDGVTPNRFGTASTITLGTATTNASWAVGTIECFTSATNVVLTAAGGNFDGTGEVLITIAYFTM